MSLNCRGKLFNASKLVPVAFPLNKILYFKFYVGDFVHRIDPSLTNS